MPSSFFSCPKSSELMVSISSSRGEADELSLSSRITSSAKTGRVSGCCQRASRPSTPSASVNVSHISLASRIFFGCKCNPTKASKLRAAAPPVTRSRRNISRNCSICGKYGIPARQTMQSTQPSTRASRVSKRCSASRCSGESLIPTLLRLTAPAIDSGFIA